jgi:hypothetical protein
VSKAPSEQHVSLDNQKPVRTFWLPAFRFLGLRASAHDKIEQRFLLIVFALFVRFCEGDLALRLRDHPQKRFIMSLIKDLREKPSNLSVGSKYTAMNGFLYLATGALLIAWPGALETAPPSPLEL